MSLNGDPKPATRPEPVKCFYCDTGIIEEPVVAYAGDGTQRFAHSSCREEAKCPACNERRIHTAEDWEHHPLKGHGFSPECGWTFDRREEGK